MQPAHTRPAMSCIHSGVSICNIYVLYGLTPKEVSRYQCRESRLMATIVYYPIAFINNVVVQLTSSQHSVWVWVLVGFQWWSRGCSMFPWKQPLSNYLAFITVQNSNEWIKNQLFNIQKMTCITTIFQMHTFHFFTVQDLLLFCTFTAWN